MHKPIKYLKVVFDTEMSQQEVDFFRGAIIEQVGHEDTGLFHNHKPDGKANYRYPLIQYKRSGNRPVLVCIEDGAVQVQAFFDKMPETLQLRRSGRTLDMKVASLSANSFNMQVWDTSFSYRIINWLPFNEEAIKAYDQLTTEEEKIVFLEKKLIGNILSFAKGIEWRVEKPIVCKLLGTPEKHSIMANGVRMACINVSFETNVFLPNYIGLGKSVSKGFGMVTTMRRPPASPLSTE